MCPKCKRLQKRRDTQGKKWTLKKKGRHENKTFEEASSDNGYVNYLLGKLVEAQYQELINQDESGYWPKIAFELPKGDHTNVSLVFRDGGLKHPSLLAFVGYLVNDPDLYAIEFAGGEAARVWTPYKPGRNSAKEVTVVRFDSQDGNWTNPKDAYEGRYYTKARDGCGKLRWMLLRSKGEMASGP